MIAKLTIEHGCIPITEQAREPQFTSYLADLHRFDPNAETEVRKVIRHYLDHHPDGVCATWMACTGAGDEWHAEFYPLYFALAAVAVHDEDARAEAAKFLGLLLWSEMLAHPRQWHFNEYKKDEEDYSVKRYWAIDHICANVKLRQAEKARRHGDNARAERLEGVAAALRAHWPRSRS